MITVTPELFRGDVACRAGELRTYVVTLTDVTTGSALGASVVSPPTSCTSAVGFSTPPLTLDDWYVGRIDGFDVDDVSVAAGSYAAAAVLPVATRTSTGLAVAPRWSTTCGIVPSGLSVDAGDAGGGVQAVFSPTKLVEYDDRALGGCIPFEANDNDASSDAGASDAENEDASEVEAGDSATDASAESDDSAVGPTDLDGEAG